ncbi:uncharacterized protein LOC111300248 [Durio zibethinus]|uniref:Uncharacterized protein LOC111300248 n=1 Tax=Durio zibethinus TaxID=66656 RepID=A0A6P5ZFK8_DURZI|nr:uncharacterized protein LOC111300248 [Durio zibethinus]
MYAAVYKVFWEEKNNTPGIKIMHNVFWRPLALPKDLHRRTLGIGRLKRKRLKKLNNAMRRVRSDMEEISDEQKKIRDGQRQVREKFEAIELECEQLRKETKLIMQQSQNTQIRLAFMFQILKARENQEFDKAAKLTVALRELIAGKNQQKHAQMPI